MSDDNEKHLPATQKRLDDAREEGNVPRSRELGAAVLLMGAGGMLYSTGPALTGQFLGLMEQGLVFNHATLAQPGLLGERLTNFSQAGLLAVLPLLAALAAAAMGANLALGGWNFTWKAVSPDFNRLNPVSGLGRLFSWHGVSELFKALLKVGLIGGVAFWLIQSDLGAYNATISVSSTGAAVSVVGELAAKSFLMLSALLILVAAVDVPFQWWRYHANLRMSMEEMKREHRESDGDPHLKGHIRQQQREAARRRMMDEVPKADVVITNPTHFAVALSYKDNGMRAPRVVAKGRDLVAARIRELAAEHGVTLVSAPPLARALYKHADIGDEIPQALFGAVAQVLAYVFQLRRWAPGRGPMPEAPEEIPVPDDLSVPEVA
jgi:flagellar biosynthesis protein FlhB